VVRDEAAPAREYAAHLPDAARPSHPADVRRASSRFDHDARRADVDLGSAPQHAHGREQRGEDVQGAAHGHGVSARRRADRAQSVARQRRGHGAASRDAMRDRRGGRRDRAGGGAEVASADLAGRVFGSALGRARRFASPLSRPAAQDGARRRAVHGGERSLRLGPTEDERGDAHGRAADVHVRRDGRAPCSLEPARCRRPRFTMPEGTPLRRENFRRRVWLPACRAAGIEGGLRFHDLRHTNATLAAASGAPLRAVMHRLGHASAAAALRYQHRVEGQDEAIAEFLDQAAVSGSRTGPTQAVPAG